MKPRTYVITLAMIIIAQFIVTIWRDTDQQLQINELKRELETWQVASSVSDAMLWQAFNKAKKQAAKQEKGNLERLRLVRKAGKDSRTSE